ncbi:hypothetical protein [Bacteroides acidifaciens]|uniref:Uncharacterized protein n=3 Tax=Bacteroides acidifaciens TaxID=85831 RepID=A0A4S2AMM7_9BACE|nr:hypothetical protein [Bacteroides acidifaciens]MCR2005406.1 hypothetical protein [Bacteroides acidifaciens]TGY02388.1 hypothetical protein E5356_10780 [Bacteroides acidifaciens]
MRQICPKCNNWVVGTPHISMQDKLGKAAISKGSAQVVGGAIGLMFGPLGSFAGSVVGSLIADNYSEKIIQTKEHDFICPKCGHQWVVEDDKTAEQLLDGNVEITRCKCCNSINAKDTRICASCGMPIIKDGIYTLSDMIGTLNEKLNTVSEQAQSLVICQLLVIGFMQENTSDSLESSYVKQFFSSVTKALSVCDRTDCEVYTQILNRMLQTMVTAKYAKMLYQKKKGRIPSDINESLQLLKETVAFVFQVIENETGEKINWVDKDLKTVYNTMQAGHELLFGPNLFHRSDEYNPFSQKAITLMEKFLLSLRQPMKECGLSLEQYKERYFTILYQTQKRSMPIAPRLKTPNKQSDIVLFCLYTVASPLWLYCLLRILHILAYMIHYMTFTLLDPQIETGIWIDFFSNYWFVLSFLFAGISGTILYTKWNKMEKKNVEVQQKYNQEVIAINSYNDELKKRIQEEMDSF